MFARVLRLGVPIGIALLALLFAACGGGDSDDGGTAATSTDEPTAAATDDSHDDNGNSDEELFDGATVQEFYTANCSACHGPNREGLVGPALIPDRLVEDDAFYVDTILNGRSGTVMPAWGAQGVSEAEATALVAFFRTAP